MKFKLWMNFLLVVKGSKCGVETVNVLLICFSLFLHVVLERTSGTVTLNETSLPAVIEVKFGLKSFMLYWSISFCRLSFFLHLCDELKSLRKR